MNGYVLLLLLYSGGLILLGLLASRSVRTAADFFVARRGLGSGVLLATLLAANIGAGSTVGAAGLGYRFGLSGWWWVGSAGVGSLILAFIVGPKIWEVAAQRDLYTVGDYLEYRYGRKVRGTIAVILGIGALAILAGQWIAVAWILNVVAGVSKPVGCLLGGIVTILYFAAGGLVSAAWVNVAQVVVKVSGFALALPVVLEQAGGWAGMREAIGAQDAVGSEYFELMGARGTEALGYLLMLAPSFIVSPGLLQKVYGARSARAVRIGVGANACILLLFAFLPVMIGMATRAVHPTLENRELALPTALVSMLPAWLGGLMLAAIFSAEVSSADAVLFMLSTSLAQDLYRTFIRPQASERELLRISRRAAVAAGVLGVLLAIVLPSIISALSIFYTLLSVALFVPLVLGLFSSRPRERDALAAIVLALVATAGAHVMADRRGSTDWPPIALGLLAALGAMIPALIRPRQ
ncbi:Sodium/pantothenate symporter [bacterium HR08]|nr:Sodium/pantothenate symporter [bacterium HR08]